LGRLTVSQRLPPNMGFVSTSPIVIPADSEFGSAGEILRGGLWAPNGPDGIEPMYLTVTSQAVTPITKTIYYYSGGQLTRDTEKDWLQRQIELFGVAFREDKVMIEAKREVINRSPDKSMMTLSCGFAA
jgi:hypothetical protein